MRYVNPHNNQVVVYPGNQQNMQQPMMQPMQQGMMTNQMQPMQMQPQVVMTAQGPMMMTAQGLVPVPQPVGGMVPMQSNMPVYNQQYVPQNQFPQMTNQSVIPQNRFSQPGNADQQHNQQEFNRYSAQQTVEQVIQEITGPELFIVKPIIHKFAGNDKFKLNTITDSIKSNAINVMENIVVCDCLEETVESLIEKTYSETDVKTLTVQKHIINNSYYKVEMKDVIENLVSDDIKTLYKNLKSIISKCVDKYQLNALFAFNLGLTNAINDYLAINSENQIDIESFITDYNDLLKILRNNEEDLEDTLVEYLNAYIGEIKSNLSIITKKDNVCYIPESITVAYLDKHLYETGLDKLSNSFSQVDETLTNVFITSIANEIVAKTNKKEFFLVTMDKSIFKCMISEREQLYIRWFI